jgi:hypothetical protein
MIVCGIEAIGAKRIGDMLDRNASLVELSLGKNPLNRHSCPCVLYCALK